MTTSNPLDTSKDCNHLELLVQELSKIGINLSAEKNIDTLLEMILQESMNITKSDAGSIYLLEGEEDNKILLFKYTKCFSKDFPFNEFALPINKNSIAGACAFLGESLNFSDMSETIDKLGIEHNKVFDNSIGYHTMNMLVIPMKNYTGEIIGVMQLINKKSLLDKLLVTDEDFYNYIVPYNKDEEVIISSLASQAAILIERSILFDEIEKQFTSFTECLVTSLDQRDPVTAGHSKRVADYAVQLAKDVSSSDYGPYADVEFSDIDLKSIYYAGLLHDVGKIGVPEYVLTKINKLSDPEFKSIEYKFHIFKNQLMDIKDTDCDSDNTLDILNSLDSDLETLRLINTAGFLNDDYEQILDKISQYEFTDIDDLRKSVLTEHELENLSIKRGNLTSVERENIEAHPQATLDVLSDIAWSKEFKHVPKVAAEHHEKLDGSGYPNGLLGAKLSLESRILGIIDIFDALTAKDRPYKPAVPLDKTLDILKSEVAKKHLDSDLVEIFINKASYSIIMGGNNGESI